MTEYLTKGLIAAAIVAALPALAGASAPQAHAASLNHEPLVMRLSKDEFRIAFGVTAQGCATHGCSGMIRYRVDWKTEDGKTASEYKRVSYTVLPNYNRALTVDRQYFDTAEGAHTTAIVRVTVATITCRDALQPQAARLAAITR
jgi:predicted secreted protein